MRRSKAVHASSPPTSERQPVGEANVHVSASERPSNEAFERMRWPSVEELALAGQHLAQLSFAIGADCLVACVETKPLQVERCG